VPSPEHNDDEGDVSFTDVHALLDFVTLRWRDRWVTTDIWDEGVVDALLRRPFFLLVSVEAPISVRWERFRARYVFVAPIILSTHCEEDSVLTHPL
jgi:dCMP deaminase